MNLFGIARTVGSLWSIASFAPVVAAGPYVTAAVATTPAGFATGAALYGISCAFTAASVGQLAFQATQLVSLGSTASKLAGVAGRILPLIV